MRVSKAGGLFDGSASIWEDRRFKDKLVNPVNFILYFTTLGNAIPWYWRNTNGSGTYLMQMVLRQETSKSN